MGIFKDSKGNTWDVAVNVGSVRQVKDALGFDLMDVVSQNSAVLTNLYEDPMTLVDTLYVLCKNQADARGVSDMEFGTAFNGDAIQEATRALIEGLLDFFPPRRREILKKMIAKMESVETAAMERIGQEIDSLDVETILNEALAAAKSGTTSNAPVPSSDVTPTA